MGLLPEKGRARGRGRAAALYSTSPASISAPLVPEGKARRMKTVKVRIALEIGPEGDWQASACSADENDWGVAMSAYDVIDSSQRYWIEAEVPVPEAEPTTISGKAVEAA